MNYYLLNQVEDFARGYLHDCTITECGVCVSPDADTGALFSRVLDGKEEQTVWHRLTVEVPDKRAEYQFWIYACDKEALLVDGEMRNIQQIIQDEHRTVAQKQGIFAPYLQKIQKNEPDFLLHDIKGRYLWIFVQLQDYHHLGCRLEKVQVYFPKDSLMKYLPAVYQADDQSTAFMERFLAVFQSFYDELTFEIENNHDRLIPYTTDSEFLYFLADLVGVENAHGWTQEQLRNLVAHSGRLYQKRGTKQVLIEAIELVTGQKPCVIEGWQIKDRPDLQTRYYSTERNSITVLLEEKHLQGGKRDSIMNLILAFTPVGMEVHLKELRQYFVLGKPLYLGVNTTIAQYEPIKLDGLSRIDYSVVGH